MEQYFFTEWAQLFYFLSSGPVQGTIYNRAYAYSIQEKAGCNINLKKN